jgi:hypothetical protein
VRRGILLTAVWSFVVVAAGYDSYFAWREQAAIDAWEMNPVARWAAGTLGVQTLIGLKAAGLAYGLALAVFCHRHYHRLGRRLTMTAGSAYFVLSVYYVFCHVSGPPENQSLRDESVQTSVAKPAQQYPLIAVPDVSSSSPVHRTKPPEH